MAWLRSTFFPFSHNIKSLTANLKQGNEEDLGYQKFKLVLRRNMRVNATKIEGEGFLFRI